VLGLKGPRKMRAVIPKVNEDGTRTTWKPSSPEESIAEKSKTPNAPGVFYMQNKSPEWNEGLHLQFVNS
jgi:hypothetical protein